MSAFSIPKTIKEVFFIEDSVNMCRSFKGLRTTLEDAGFSFIEIDNDKVAHTRRLYFFRNKKHNYIKVMYFSKGSWRIFAAKTKHGVFNTPKNLFSLKELQKLIDSPK